MNNQTISEMRKIYLILLKLSLNIHTYAYKFSTIFAIKAYGVHPKHRIINYKDWFNSKISKDDVVLDIGSKTGEMAFHMSNKCKNVYGIEIEKHSHDEALKRYSKENLKFVNADATNFNYVNEINKNISVVTMSNVLEHIDNRKEFLRDIIKQINNKNKKVKILIRVPSIEREWVTPLKKSLGLVWKLDRTHFTEYTKEELNDELKSINYFHTEIDTKFGEIYAVYLYKK